MRFPGRLFGVRAARSCRARRQPRRRGVARRFKEKYKLPFTLLADPEHAVAEQYGVWAEKNYAGKKYWGVQRSTFVIDADGKLLKAMHNVKPDGHPQQVLAALPS